MLPERVSSPRGLQSAVRAGGRRAPVRMKEDAWLECYGEEYENIGKSKDDKDFKSFVVGSGNAHYIQER